jgi:formylglycine-generating enzyme required for sulfatase activity
MQLPNASAFVRSLTVGLLAACAGGSPTVPSEKVAGPSAGALAGTEWVVIPEDAVYVLDQSGATFSVPIEYHVMTTEVTGDIWTAVAGGAYQGVGVGAGNLPREEMSWDDITGGSIDGTGLAAGGWLGALNDDETAAGRTDYWYLLPTEEQWMAAARGKTTYTAGGGRDWCRTNQAVGDATDDVDVTAANLADYAVFGQPFLAGSEPVGGKASCGGLFDMFGNVSEWTATANYTERKTRGGFWNSDALNTSHQVFDDQPPNAVLVGVGFRVVRVARSAPPGIDGVMSPGEWDNAAYTFGPVTVNLPGGGTTTATVLIRNDGTNLLMAVTFDQDLSSFNTHTLSVKLDENPVDGDWNLGGDGNGDDGFVVHNTAFGVVRDRFFDMHFNCGPFDNPAAPCQGQTDLEWGGTNDGPAAVGNDGATTVIEMSHPLNSGDFRDAVLTSGQSYGLWIFTNIGGPVPAEPLVRTDLVPAWAAVVVQ